MIVIPILSVLMASGVVIRGFLLLRKASGELDSYDLWCKETEPKLEIVK